MRKLIYWLIPLMFLIALCIYIFNPTKEYDLLTQLEIIAKLPFNNPLDAFNELIQKGKNMQIIAENGTNIWETLQGIGALFISVFTVPVKFIIMICQNIYYGFQSVLIILGII